MMKRSKPLVIDLFSGMGGWSAAFRDRGWQVIMVDNNPKFNPHICVDIMDLPSYILPKKPEVILASPPCNRFSMNAVTFNWKKRKIKNQATVIAVGMVAKTLFLIKELKPRYWVLENPRGMLRNVLGKPDVETFFASWGSSNLKPTDLWGRMPFMEWPQPKEWARDGEEGCTRKKKNSAIAAEIPYNLSMALCLAIEDELIK